MNPDPIRLLLVEDNAGDALLLREVLAGIRNRKYEVTHAASLEAGLGLVGAQLFDAILLDLSLPDSQGVRTLECVHAACGHIPIIVLTGLDDQDIGNEAVRMGAQDYLVKGKFHSNALARCVRYAIERKGAQQALEKAHDELEQRVLERTADLERITQILAMMSACNKALVRASDEKSLLNQICEIIVNVGRYKMAWIGFAGDEPDKKVVPAAWAGFESGYLESAGVTWAETDRGMGPAGTAIRTAQVRVADDFLTEPDLSPWRESALERGFRSSIALPLVSSGRTLGALSVYAGQPAAFDERQIETLKELADDLTFGIVAFRTQDALRRAELEVLQAGEREQQRIGRDMHDGIQGGLVGITMMLGSLKMRLASCSLDQTKLTADVEWLIQAVRETLNQTRGLVQGLCPPNLHSDGFVNALRQLAANTHELFGVECQIRCGALVRVEDETTATQLYRICQEALNNAIKHSQGKLIEIQIEGDSNSLTLEIRDNGVGLPDDACLRGGMGLGTMSYRARMIGAHLLIRRRSEGGTMVRCSVPDSGKMAGNR